MYAEVYLSRIEKLNLMIDQKIKEKDDLKAMMTCIGSFDYSKERVQTSPSGEAPFETTIEKIIKLEEEITQKIDEYIDLKDEAINKIHELPNPIHAKILYEKYVKLKSIDDIANIIKKSYSHTVNLHRAALKAFDTLNVD